MALRQVVEAMSQDQKIAAAGAERTALLAANLKLYKSTLVPTPANVVADFDAAEADFVGYAASVQVWDAVGIDADGNVGYSGSGPAFTATDGTVPNEIGGAWLESGPGILYAYYQFPIPVTIASALAQIGAEIFRRAPGPGFGIFNS